MCLPHSWLATMRWTAKSCAKSMSSTVSYFDRRALPARLDPVRRAVLGEQNPGLFMSEAFAAAAFTTRAPSRLGKHGVLNWLIAARRAAFANLSDQN